MPIIVKLTISFGFIQSHLTVSRGAVEEKADACLGSVKQLQIARPAKYRQQLRNGLGPQAILT